MIYYLVAILVKCHLVAEVDSLFLTLCILDPDSPKKAKMKHLQRQYSSVRRKLEELEREQEEARGFSLSRAEKLKSKPMQKLMAEMSKLKVSVPNLFWHVQIDKFSRRNVTQFLTTKALYLQGEPALLSHICTLAPLPVGAISAK